jgi:4-nitrophenyl phosphatase
MQLPFASDIKGLVIDLDGVLWRGEKPIVNIPQVFKKISDLKIKAILVTNNSTLTQQQFKEKLFRLGAELDPDQIFNSSLATALYLKKHFPVGAKVFAVGEAGLIDSIKEAGFLVNESNEEAQAVVAGIDYSFNYSKLNIAMRLIRKGALFVGTNPDHTFPSPEGLNPGAGSILAAIQTASDTNPIIIGKPSPVLFQMAIEHHHLQPENVMMVGDRLDTDILGGQRAGLYTALVLSGVTVREEAEKWEPQPDIIVPNLEVLLDVLESGK